MPIRRRLPLLLLASALALLAVRGGVEAAMYPGYADTGWAYYDKSWCCEDAIAEAVDDSAARCEQSGGWPQPRYAGTQQGTCQWQWRQDAYGDRVYRCSATARVRCK
jgi:hypothetical protein